MINIRKLNYFDKSKLKELSSFLNHEEGNFFIDIVTNGLSGHLQYYLPLKYKILDESYLLTDEDRILGLITVHTFNGNPYKINISQLCFIENAYEVAQQLIEFIVAQYGAMGANTFYLTINESYGELNYLLVNSCGFREISTEEIWKVKKSAIRKSRNLNYRRIKKSDAKELSDLYNDSVYTHFKPALLRNSQEFYEPIFSGLKYTNEYHYVIEEPSVSRIIAYFKISTADNEKYIIDFNYSNGYEVNFNDIFYFAKREILKRTKNYKLYVKLRNYLNTNQAQKDYFIKSDFKWVSTQKVFIKDFFKILKEYSPENKFAVLGGLHNSPTF